MTKNAQDFEKERRLALISHDLRSAVGDVLGGLQLVDDAPLDSQSQMQLERVRAAGETVHRLMDEAMASLVGADDESLSSGVQAGPGPCALIDLVRDLERRWAGHACADNLSLVMQVAPNLPVRIGADGVRLERILSNLIGNALKYTQGGTITVSVSLDADESLRFSVRDHGPGFSDASLARLFAFGGRPAGSKQPGSGMGLHIAKTLADGLGGTLCVENTGSGTERQGAVVSLILPRDAWRVSDCTANLPDLRGCHALLAEDNATNQILLMRMLRELGATTDLVRDGAEALGALRQGGYDLALVDMHLPHVSGSEVIAAIRALPDARATVPILAVTAVVGRGCRARIHRAGADGILTKPVMSLAAFGDAISAVLGCAPQALEHDDAGIDPHPMGAVRLPHLLEIAGPAGRGELLDRLEEDVATAVSDLASGMDRGDAESIRGQTHVLISLTGALGATGLQTLMEQLNNAAHENDWTRMQALHLEATAPLDALNREIAQAQQAERAERPTADGPRWPAALPIGWVKAWRASGAAGHLSTAEAPGA